MIRRLMELQVSTKKDPLQQKHFFGTDGIRGRLGQTSMTPEFILKLGWAAGVVLSKQGSNTVLIGKDTRISGYLLESALQSGLLAAGSNIQLLGPMPTPAVAFLTKQYDAAAGIVISASHNPYYDNGIKFFSHLGEKLSDEIEYTIEKQLALPMTIVESEALGKAERFLEAAKAYAEFCKNTIVPIQDLKGLKIAVDCANGATYHIVPRLLTDLGAHVYAINVEPDGLNINDACGSTSPEAISALVKSKQCDIGIAFDGDGDRVVMVDHTGIILDGDDLLYILAKYQKNRGVLKNGIVGTVMTNLGIDHALKELGIELVRTNVGDRYVIAELKKRGWTLGGESSGHIIDLQKTTTGDGIIIALQIIRIMIEEGLSLHALKQGVVKFPQVQRSVEMETPINSEQHSRLKTITLQAEETLVGLGRVLLRPSGTEPVMRIMIEGEDLVRVTQLADEIAEQVKLIIER